MWLSVTLRVVFSLGFVCSLPSVSLAAAKQRSSPPARSRSGPAPTIIFNSARNVIQLPASRSPSPPLMKHFNSVSRLNPRNAPLKSAAGGPIAQRLPRVSADVSRIPASYSVIGAPLVQTNIQSSVSRQQHGGTLMSRPRNELMKTIPGAITLSSLPTMTTPPKPSRSSKMVLPDHQNVEVPVKLHAQAAGATTKTDHPVGVHKVAIEPSGSGSQNNSIPMQTIAFANSAVPSYAKKAHSPVLPAGSGTALPKSLLGAAGAGGAVIPNYFLMNPPMQKQRSTDSLTAIRNVGKSGDENKTQSEVGVDVTLRDLHHEWKSEILKQYYHTISSANVPSIRNMSDALDKNKTEPQKASSKILLMTANTMNSSDGVSLNKLRNVPVSNDNKLALVRDVATTLNSSSRNYERVSRNASASLPVNVIVRNASSKDGVSLINGSNTMKLDQRETVVKTSTNERTAGITAVTTQRVISAVIPPSVGVSLEDRKNSSRLDKTKDVYIPTRSTTSDKMTEYLGDATSLLNVPTTTPEKYPETTEARTFIETSDVIKHDNHLPISSPPINTNTRQTQNTNDSEDTTEYDMKFKRPKEGITGSKTDVRFMNEGSISKAINSAPLNVIPSPPRKDPNRFLYINNSGIAAENIRLKPEERTVLVTLVDKQGKKIVVPAIFTPTDTKAAPSQATGLSALQVNADAKISLPATPKPSVLNTAEENKIKDTNILKHQEHKKHFVQHESTSSTARSTTLPMTEATNLIDLIWRSATEAVTPMTTTSIPTTEGTRVTNLIDLILQSATESPVTTTQKTTKGTTTRTTNLIDLIWQSASESPVTTTQKTTKGTTTRTTNLIDLIWQSATESPMTTVPTTTTVTTTRGTNLIDLIWQSATSETGIESTTPQMTQVVATESTPNNTLIPVLKDIINQIEARLNELQEGIANGNTSLIEEVNLLAAKMVEDSDNLAKVSIDRKPDRDSYLVRSSDRNGNRRPGVRVADIVRDTAISPVLTRLRDEVSRGAERIRKEMSHFADDTAETLMRGVDDASERVSKITATSYRGALQTRDAFVGLLGKALENMGVFVSNALQDTIETAFGTARSVGQFIEGLNENLIGGILRQGESVRNLFANTIEEMGKAGDRTIEVVNRVVDRNIKTITEDI
ncbi:mucin-5AC [Hyalella azteca]|uniref:Mucin-5AC n=1 Tax=Hyalella azteca TaxID=294128 RepID=A0A8B7N786_HYAAZ|nr:mucin-5AC [Hyalella azteca]XP_018009144.1 mucin-5AC [Hyalella azteca]